MEFKSPVAALLLLAGLFLAVQVHGQSDSSQVQSGWRVIPEDENFPTGDVIVAFSQITDPEYNLPSDPAETDCTAAIQSALDAAASAGGGTVFIPAGEYRIDGTLLIDSNVILRGRWREITEEQEAGGTILALYNKGQDPIFHLGGNGCGLRDLTFWHPGQLPDAIQPTPYPFVIAGDGKQTTIENITLVNAYNGIDMSRASMCCLRGIYGSPLRTGLTADRSYAVSRFDAIHFSPEYWAWSGLPGSPDSPDDDHATYMRNNGTAVDIREMDGFYFVFSTISGYSKGVVLRAGATGDDPWGSMAYITVTESDYGLFVEESKFIKIGGCTFNGAEYGIYGGDNSTELTINASTVEGGIHSVAMLAGSASLVNCSLSGSTSTSGSSEIIQTTNAMVMPVFNNTYDRVRKPARMDLFNVADYGAVGDGVSDDTAALQSAVAAARSNGGGIVFVPDGEYLMTGTLDLGQGVELRGTSGGRHVADVRDELGSLLLIKVGKGNAGGTAFLTMGDYSGIRGMGFHYPDQLYDDDFAYDPYPFMVQANGFKNYIIDCFASNPYQAAELNGDDHLVEYTFFGGLRRTYRANNCTGGRIQNCHVKPDFWRDIHLPGNPENYLGPFKWDIGRELEVFYLNGCDDYSISSIFNHASHTFVTVDNSSGQTLMTACEQVQHGYRLINGTKTFNFLLSGCLPNNQGDDTGRYGIKTFPGFNGFARFFAGYHWGTSGESWAAEDGHLYIQQSMIGGFAVRGAMNFVCGPGGALALESCVSEVFFGIDNDGLLTLQNCDFKQGMLNGPEPEYRGDNRYESVYVLADLNQDPFRDYGLKLDTSNIVMEEANMTSPSAKFPSETDARRFKSARLGSGDRFFLDVTDPGFMNGNQPVVDFEFQFFVDTQCTIKVWYDSLDGTMKLARSISYDGSASFVRKTLTTSVSDARFSAPDNKDVIIEIIGDSPMLTMAAISSWDLPAGDSGVTRTGFENWSNGFGGAGLIGFEADDFDGDGYANFLEYALGGDPVDFSNSGDKPLLQLSNGTVSYIHPQRTDDIDLVYTVETCSNLASGIWTDVSDASFDLDVTGGNFNYATHHYLLGMQPAYYRLKIQYAP